MGVRGGHPFGATVSQCELVKRVNRGKTRSPEYIVGRRAGGNVDNSGRTGHRLAV